MCSEIKDNQIVNRVQQLNPLWINSNPEWMNEWVSELVTVQHFLRPSQYVSDRQCSPPKIVAQWCFNGDTCRGREWRRDNNWVELRSRGISPQRQLRRRGWSGWDDNCVTVSEEVRGPERVSSISQHHVHMSKWTPREETDNNCRGFSEEDNGKTIEWAHAVTVIIMIRTRNTHKRVMN